MINELWALRRQKHAGKVSNGIWVPTAIFTRITFNPRTLALVKIFCSNAPAATLAVSRIRKRNIFDFGKTLAHDGGAFAGSACIGLGAGDSRAVTVLSLIRQIGSVDRAMVTHIIPHFQLRNHEGLEEREDTNGRQKDTKIPTATLRRISEAHPFNKPE